MRGSHKKNLICIRAVLKSFFDAALAAKIGESHFGGIPAPADLDILVIIVCASDEFSAVDSVVQIILKRPMGDGGIFTGYFDPVVMTMVAGGYIVGELALHCGEHTVTANVFSSGGIVYKHEIIGEAGTQSVPVLLVEAVPIICLKSFYGSDILLYLYTPFEFVYALFKLSISDTGYSSAYIM